MEILKISLSATGFILVILIIRALALHKLPQKTFNVLWGLALCRLIVPFTIPSQFSIYNLVNLLNNKISAADTTIIGMAPVNMGTAADAINNTLSEEVPVSISPALVIWLIGLLACALFFLVTHLRCRREYNTALPINNEFVRKWIQGHPIRCNIKIQQSDKIAAPLTYGILRPVILLPKQTDWSDETSLKIILTHEFVHIRRFDTLTKLLLAAALCIHWFNPFVWVMYVLANRDIELSCDETVLLTFGETMKSVYALTLIGLEEKKCRMTPLVNNFSKNAIEERIKAIMKFKKASLMGMVLALALVIGTTILFATNATSTNGKDQKNENVTFAEETAYVETPESKAEMYAVYEQYGLTYNKSTDQLFYYGELVRYYEDYYPIGEDSSAGRDYFNENGTIDVHSVRDLSQLTRNTDGSTDPSGKLTGVEPYSQAEFDARDIEELKNPTMQATSVGESSVAYSSSTAQEALQDNASQDNVAIAYSSEDMVTPDELAKTYAIYEPFGLTYDKKQDRLYYNGKLVRYFIDILSSNGESLTGGKFKGSIRQINSPDGKGEVDVYTVRDYGKLDAEGSGTLTDVKAYSQVEFDAQTKNRNESSNGLEINSAQN